MNLSRRIYLWKPYYSMCNLIWLLFFAPQECLGKRNAYYDRKAGYIYAWQMHLINLIKNRHDFWTLEKEWHDSDWEV